MALSMLAVCVAIGLSWPLIGQESPPALELEHVLYPAEGDRLTGTTFSGDGRHLATVSYPGGELTFWNLEQGSRVVIPKDPDNPISGLRSFAHGREILVVTPWHVEFRDPSTGHVIRRLDTVQSYGRLAGAPLSPDGRYLTCLVRRFDLLAPERGPTHEHYTELMAWTPDASRWISAKVVRGSPACPGPTDYLFQVRSRSGDVLAEQIGWYQIQDVRVSVDGKLIALSTSSSVEFLRVRDLEPVRSLAVDAYQWCFLDDRYGVAWGDAGLTLWNLEIDERAQRFSMDFFFPGLRQARRRRPQPIASLGPPLPFAGALEVSHDRQRVSVTTGAAVRVFAVHE